MVAEGPMDKLTTKVEDFIFLVSGRMTKTSDAHHSI
jgi:hypothetical protein